MRCKEDRAELTKDVRDALVTLLGAETLEDFDIQWHWIQEEYADQQAWVKYMQDEWIPKKERWVKAWRKVRFLFTFVVFNYFY